MSKRTAQIRVGGWNCSCTIEELPQRGVQIVLQLSPNLQYLGEIRASFRSIPTIQLDLGDRGLRELRTSSLHSNLGGGRVSVSGRFDDIRAGDVQAVLVEFGGDAQRIELS